MSNRLLYHSLRHWRRRRHISQRDFALLLGGRSSDVSRYELLQRLPTLEKAIAYTVILDADVGELFPGLENKIRGQVAARARLLLRKYSKARPTKNTQAVMQLLRRMAKQAE